MTFTSRNVTNSNNGSVFVSLRFIPTHVELEYTWTKLCNTEFVFIGLSFSIPFQSSCSLFSFTVCTSHYLSPRGGGGRGADIKRFLMKNERPMSRSGQDQLFNLCLVWIIFQWKGKF